MAIYTITSAYMFNFLFGSYTTILNARNALIEFFNQNPDFVRYEDAGDYTYIGFTKNGEAFGFSILYNILDAD